jgi:hypothetical protein
MSQAQALRIAVLWMLDGAELSRSNPGFATLRPKASRVFDQMTGRNCGGTIADLSFSICNPQSAISREVVAEVARRPR